MPNESKQLIFSLNNFANSSNSSASNFEFTFIPDDEYHTLWLYIKDDVDGQAFAYLDGFKFIDCPEGSKVFTGNNTLKSTTREDFIKFQNAANYSIQNENIEILAGNYIEMENQTDIIASTDGVGLFDITNPCSLADFFCQPADPPGQQRKKSQQMLSTNAKANSVLQVPKFYIGNRRFTEPNLQIEKDTYFSATIYSIDGRILWNEQQIRYDQNFNSKIFDRQISFYIVEFRYGGQTYRQKLGNVNSR